MKYRNTITGAVIEVASEINGGNWEPVAPDSAEEKAKVAPVQQRKAKRNNE